MRVQVEIDFTEAEIKVNHLIGGKKFSIRGLCSSTFTHQHHGFLNFNAPHCIYMLRFHALLLFLDGCFVRDALAAPVSAFPHVAMAAIWKYISVGIKGKKSSCWLIHCMCVKVQMCTSCVQVSVQVCKCPSRQMWMWATMLMSYYANVQVCKCASM